MTHYLLSLLGQLGSGRGGGGGGGGGGFGGIGGIGGPNPFFGPLGMFGPPGEGRGEGSYGDYVFTQEGMHNIIFHPLHEILTLDE